MRACAVATVPGAITLALAQAAEPMVIRFSPVAAQVMPAGDGASLVSRLKRRQAVVRYSSLVPCC